MRSLPVAVIVLVTVGCGGDDGDTLTPLPISAVTVTTTLPPPSDGGTEPTVTANGPPPVGDWDGARYDVGAIAAVGETDGQMSISLDRYSYADPVRGVIDAPAFEEEPLASWWRESPFSNVRTQLRTFVLDPDVEVLVLADDPGACSNPPPASAPAPRWQPADVDALADTGSIGAVAVLTYSATGQVTRIRLTHGC
jgi:hypothetical protein